MMIRPVNISDLAQIAKVHSLCFPESYSSQLSKYQCFVDDGGGAAGPLLRGIFE